MHLKILDKQEKNKVQYSGRRETIKIRAKINKIKTKKTYIKNQWNEKLVIWNCWQDQHTLIQRSKMEEGKNPNQ
jgi:hypothetical protein